MKWLLSITLAVFCVSSGSVPCRAQASQADFIEIELRNYVVYYFDEGDLTKFALETTATTPLLARNFRTFVSIGDVVAINGKPAKGTLTERRSVLLLRTTPTPGQAIADVVRNAIVDRYYEILQADGTPVGSLMISGLSGGGGSSPPGAPITPLTGENVTIVGGSGAFLGMRGQEGVISSVGTRQASVREDPAQRRALGGGTILVRFHLIPMSRPEILAVTHASNFTLVTTASPARSGEDLTLWATGLGPTRPGVNPGQPFTASPLQTVNSPLEVSLNGVPVEVLYAGGVPGTVDGYQINIRLPTGITPGMANLQVSVAWIAGPGVKIATR
jgi:hypothetical protein